MTKIGRNDLCPCGSGKKFKKCCWLRPPEASTPAIALIRVVREITSARQELFRVELSEGHPTDVYFDTNVWRSMSSADLETLFRLQNEHGFRYRYSMTNYVELISHLAEGSSKGWPDPFGIVKGACRRIRTLCHSDVLPSPEMEFLQATGLAHYLDPVWVPNVPVITKAIELITKAESLDELLGGTMSTPEGKVKLVAIVNPEHYQHLRQMDGNSMKTVMARLPNVSKPLPPDFTNKLTAWFLTLASFFFLIRPSGKQVRFGTLTPQERDRFVGAFTQGFGRVFAQHCKFVAQRILLKGKAIDPNDLYDMLQLILLRDPKRFFVTEEKAFFGYGLEPEIQRVVRWSGFRRST